MKRLVYGLIAALLIVGCSDSKNTNTEAVPAPATTSDTVSVGTITGFGSVISNGTEFNTDAATVTMDGQPGNLFDLRVGMVVAIRATVNSQTGAATASAIDFTDDAEGPVMNINMANHSFVVLGRTVLFDEITVFDNATIDTLANGNIVQVSGQWRSQERIQATHIERKAHAYAAGMQMQVKGEINGLDIGMQRFNIGTQVCDYSAAMLELGGADLADGLYVGVSSSSPMSNGDLMLDRIQARDRDRLCDGDCDFDLSGYITMFVSPTEFEVDASPVTTTDTTVYVKGTVGDLALDVQLAVSGTVDATGVLVADRIVFRMPSTIEIEADVEAVDTENSTTTVLGVVVTTDASTLFRDHSSASVREFWLDDLAIGDRVKLHAYLDGDTVVATRLERRDADDSVTLKAFVEAVARPSVTLLGMTVASDEDTVFQNATQQVIDADEFFSLVETGSLVRAEGSYDGTTILAGKLFLRECENDCL